MVTSALLLHSWAHRVTVHRVTNGDGARRDKKLGGGPMDLHSRGAAKSPRHRAQIACAQCGNNLFMPEWSELVDDRRVRHLWECDACGYAFETTVHFAEAA